MGNQTKDQLRAGKAKRTEPPSGPAGQNHQSKAKKQPPWRTTIGVIVLILIAAAYWTKVLPGHSRGTLHIWAPYIRCSVWLQQDLKEAGVTVTDAVAEQINADANENIARLITAMFKEQTVLLKTSRSTDYHGNTFRVYVRQVSERRSGHILYHNVVDGHTMPEVRQISSTDIEWVAMRDGESNPRGQSNEWYGVMISGDIARVFADGRMIDGTFHGVTIVPVSPRHTTLPAWERYPAITNQIQTVMIPYFVSWGDLLVTLEALHEAGYLDNRAYNALKSERINTLYEIVAAGGDSISSLPGIGPKMMRTIKDCLDQLPLMPSDRIKWNDNTKNPDWHTNWLRE